MNEKGIVFQIQRFCTDDGPGIRTTVFLKGCMLDCKWCHNPESNEIQPNIALDFTRCVNCGACASICSCHEIKNGKHIFNGKDCVKCGKCIEICRAKALSFCGKEMSTEEILNEVKSDMPFYKHSGGGLTLSGGEILYQSKFARDILQEAKKLGIHTCIETTGAASYEKLSSLAEFTDVILYDVKETDSINHKKYIGIGNELILDNLAKLNRDNHCVIMRCPIIPAVNDRYEHFDKLIEIYNTHKNIIDIQLLPYHQLGKGKAERYGMMETFVEFEVPKKEISNQWKTYIKERIRK